MKYTKEIEFSESRVRFVSRVGTKTVIHLFVCALISAGAIVLLALLTFGFGSDPEPYRVAIFGSLTGVFGAIFLFCIVYGSLKFRCKYNAVADDEHFFVRYGSGYIKFNRYELGEIKTAAGTVCGRGDKNFEILRGGIRFFFGEKNRFVRIPEWDKLAYVLSNMAEFPDSGVNWGVAYDSL